MDIQLKCPFDNRKAKLFIAFTYPYSYSEMLADLSQLESEFSEDESVYFRKETLVRSAENRDVYLLTITSNDSIGQGGAPVNESFISGEGLFPERKPRPKKY